jgi:hypothetical protein
MRRRQKEETDRGDRERKIQREETERRGVR